MDRGFLYFVADLQAPVKKSTVLPPSQQLCGRRARWLEISRIWIHVSKSRFRLPRLLLHRFPSLDVDNHQAQLVLPECGGADA